MARKTKEPAAGSRAKLAAVAKLFADFRPARETLKVVRAVPTRFPQFDHATQVGGFPLERVSVVHGPSSEGKTTFTLGLLGSFVDAGHFALLVDAERTTPITWVREVLGPAADSDWFYADRPDSYEATVDRVRAFASLVLEAREKKLVSPDTSALVVVDSIRKLVPEDVFRKIAKEGAAGAKGSVDGMGGRAAQIRAAMNAAWMDELVPLLEKTSTAIVLIARETEDPDADVWQRKFGNAFKVGGGRALIYDASLVARVERASWVYDKKGEDRKVLGERHRVSIRKTKIGGREDRVSVGYFHSSNGVGLEQAGGGWRLDRARDVLELAQRVGVVDGLSHGGKRLGRGELEAVHKLRADPALLAGLEREARAKAESLEPTLHDEDGVIQE